MLVPGKIITFTTEFDDDLATTQPCERLCNRSVPLGRMLQLYCEANVDKSDRFSTDLRWYKDGKTVPGPFDDERHYSIDSYILSDLNTGAYNRRASLKIERTDQNDSAEYTCSSRKNSEQYENITVNINIVDMPEVPVGVKVVSKSSRSVKLAWEKPWNSVDNKSSFIEYFVKYKTIDESWLNDSKMLSVKSNENNVEITELRPATSYNVRIFAKNDYFQSEPFEMDVITTDGNSKPSGQPRNIKIESTKPNSLRVSWKSPPRSEWNGEISGYKLGYWLSNGSEMACHYENFKIDSSELNEDKEFSFEIIDLQPNIQYSIVIHAYNQFGAGPRSDEYKQYTIKNIPNSPDWYIECTPLHSNILGVSWDIRNDISSYTVIYTEQKLWNNAERKEHVFTKKSYVTLDELKSHTNYTIQVLATTSTGDSEESDPIDCATLDGKLVFNDLIFIL